MTDEEVERAQWLLNNRPRKVLGWKFPAEVYQEALEESATIGWIRVTDDPEKSQILLTLPANLVGGLPLAKQM